MFSALCLVLLASLSCLCLAQQPVVLPGYEGPAINSTSGYVSIGDQRIFYIHTASLVSPETDPVVFWFQGGPGGSSMIGLFTEMGPFAVQSDTKVTYRAENWLAKGANMIFVDQPACVGFSYSLNERQDCNSSDTKAAATNYVVIKTIMQDVFPEYASRPFWVQGESYGGAYVPMMSALIAEKWSSDNHFQGVMIGNPVMMCYAASDPLPFGVGDTWTQFNQLYWNGKVPQHAYELWRTQGCDSEAHRQGKYMPECIKIFNDYSSQDNLGSDFDPDDLFGDFCTGNGTLSYALSECGSVAHPTGDGTIFGKMGSYLSQANVQKAMNAHVQFNSQQNHFLYTHDGGDMLQYYVQMLSHNPSLKILIYSGLADVFTVPFSYTMPCVYKLNNMMLNSSLSSDWQVWHHNNHTAGHWMQWKNGFTYATIKGAGHESPTYQPVLLADMFDRFLHKHNMADENQQHQNTRGVVRSNTRSVMKQSELLEKFIGAKR